MATARRRPIFWADPAPQRALVIEADPALRARLAALLEEEGYAVTETDSVFGTHTLARELAPAVILLDVELPYRSGLSLLPQLKADPQTAVIPVIVLTATADLLPPHRRSLAAAFVRKPCHAAALRAALRTARAAQDAPPASTTLSTSSARAASRVSRRASSRVPQWQDRAGQKAACGAARVLVVDDDPTITAFVSAALKDEGYAVEIASDGAAALGLLAARHPEVPAVILLDMQMPVMDGAAFARQYRDTPAPHAPLICITAADSAPEQCHAIGADDFLGKPFTLRDLRALVDRHATRSA